MEEFVSKYARVSAFFFSPQDKNGWQGAKGFFAIPQNIKRLTPPMFSLDKIISETEQEGAYIGE